jgi:uncharacterized protein (UPF0335 family)
MPTVGRPNLREPAPGSIQAYVESIETLEREKREIGKDVSELYKSAKDAGHDVSLIREMLKLRKIDADALREREEKREDYMRQLDMFAGPVERAATKFRDTLRQDGVSATLHAAGMEPVKIA